jgi:hypothetical protein
MSGLDWCGIAISAAIVIYMITLPPMPSLSSILRYDPFSKKVSVKKSFDEVLLAFQDSFNKAGLDVFGFVIKGDNQIIVHLSKNSPKLPRPSALEGYPIVWNYDLMPVLLQEPEPTKE